MGTLVTICLLLAATIASFAVWLATRNQTAPTPDRPTSADLDAPPVAKKVLGTTKKPRTAPQAGVHRTAGVATILLAATTAAVIGFTSLTIVPVQQVGIPVTFGSPGQPLANGVHAKLPWTDVTLMDGTVQIDDNLGDRRTEIRLGNQSIAYVQNNVRWRIRPEAADRLFRDHKTFERIGTALEEPELAAALNAALQDYNPLGALTGEEKSRDQIADEVKARLNEKLGDRLIIESVTIPVINFDNETQGRINAYQTEIGNTRIAEQRRKTAEAEAAANRTLSESVSNTPNVLVSKCLDTVNEMVQRGQAIPVGFSCWPGGGGAGGVLVDNTTRR